jgi:hypothetical protein
MVPAELREWLSWKGLLAHYEDQDADFRGPRVLGIIIDARIAFARWNLRDLLCYYLYGSSGCRRDRHISFFIFIERVAAPNRSSKELILLSVLTQSECGQLLLCEETVTKRPEWPSPALRLRFERRNE